MTEASGHSDSTCPVTYIPAVAGRMTSAVVDDGWDWAARLTDHTPLVADLPSEAIFRHGRGAGLPDAPAPRRP